MRVGDKIGALDHVEARERPRGCSIGLCRFELLELYGEIRYSFF